MKQGSIISYILYFIAFALLQLLFFRNVILFNYALCFIYIGYIITFPINVKPIPLMLIAFFMGILMDSFFDTVGINAFACVLLAFIRPHILNILTPGGGYVGQSEISISSLGFVWFSKYSIALILIHHFVFFLIEAWSFTRLMEVFLHTFLSGIFTFVVLLLIQNLTQRMSK